ncbi:MAG TPA: hypothetical protein VGP79_16495 [Bryobacteraceae bacterium]|nr:hypothetical protein [Bryobacteraceae bacterium]
MNDTDGNIDHLKRTIAAMREQLELMKFEQQGKIQEAVAAVGAENLELKKTIEAMRSEMDRIQIKHSERIQDLTRTARDEQNHMQEMIAKLRNQLEEKLGR